MRFFILAIILFSLSANAEIETIIIKDRAISVSEIVIPKDSRIEFKIQNLDKDFEEVKSKELGLKIEVPLNSEVTVSMPALKPGTYPFKVDFVHSLSKKRNDKVIEGKIIVK